MNFLFSFGFWNKFCILVLCFWWELLLFFTYLARSYHSSVIWHKLRKLRGTHSFDVGYYVKHLQNITGKPRGSFQILVHINVWQTKIWIFNMTNFEAFTKPNLKRNYRVKFIHPSHNCSWLVSIIFVIKTRPTMHVSLRISNLIMISNTY